MNELHEEAYKICEAESGGVPRVCVCKNTGKPPCSKQLTDAMTDRMRVSKVGATERNDAQDSNPAPEKIKHMPMILRLIEAENGGWILQKSSHHPFTEEIPIGAFSNTQSMLIGLDNEIQLHRSKSEKGGI